MNNKDNKDNKDIDRKLESLKRIRKVEVPPYLFTGIKAKINNINDSYSEAPSQWKWAFAVTAFAVIILNVSIILKSNSPEVNNEGIEKVITSMHISNNNDFYLSNNNE